MLCFESSKDASRITIRSRITAHYLVELVLDGCLTLSSKYVLLLLEAKLYLSSLSRALELTLSCVLLSA